MQQDVGYGIAAGYGQPVVVAVQGQGDVGVFAVIGLRQLADQLGVDLRRGLDCGSGPVVREVMWRMRPSGGGRQCVVRLGPSVASSTVRRGESPRVLGGYVGCLLEAGQQRWTGCR